LKKKDLSHHTVQRQSNFSMSFGMDKH
jgi:hypothetical protein